ncbi:MAG: Fimbrial assembly family protein, partial [Pedosphaera sp.]|nr:Fimbrial assembly family protein [Pedosphaera sp.]
MGDKLKKPRWNSCNVLQVGADSRQLWEFAAGKGGFTLSHEQSIATGDPLPAKVVAKEWKVLFQPKLNLALLPIDKAFLRVV